MNLRNKRMRRALSAALLVGVSLAGCNQSRESRSPLLEQTSARSIEDEANRALENVRSAAETMASSPDETSTALAEAETSLVHLTAYYLPLLEARARAYNAYSYYQSGRTEMSSEELVAVEEILLSIAQGALPRGEALVSPPTEKLAEANMAVSTVSPSAPVLLEELASLLNQLILKGDIELSAE